jgi:hypothetical protein
MSIRVAHCRVCGGTGFVRESTQIGWHDTFCRDCTGTGHTVLESIGEPAREVVVTIPPAIRSDLMDPDYCENYDPEECKPGDACDDCELAYREATDDETETASTEAIDSAE